MNREDATRLAEDLYSKPRPPTPTETEQLVEFILHGLEPEPKEEEDDSGGLEAPIALKIGDVRLVIDEIDEGNYGIRHDPPRNAGDGLTESVTIEFSGWPVKVELVDGS